MDAVKFLKTLRRMCNCECHKCEFGKARSGFETCPVWQRTYPEEAVAIAEKWAKDHPIKTRQSEFLKQWPEARINDADGVLKIQPCSLNRDMGSKCKGVPCEECRKAFWLAEVE